jgi:hypothetical protein
VYRQNIRFSTTPLRLFPLKINVIIGKCCRNWFQTARPEKKILRKPGCRHRQALTRRGMTITARFEKSDNKTGRKQWISGRYDPSSGVSGQDEPDKTALMTTVYAC